jgi:hypothetical protein
MNVLKIKLSKLKAVANIKTLAYYSNNWWTEPSR